MSAFPSSAVLLCLLLAAMSRSILGQCPTRPVNAKGESESNADSEEAKECDVYTIIQCSSNSSTSTSLMTSTSSPSSTSTGSTSTASSASTTNSSDTTSSAASSSTSTASSTSSASSAATTSASSEPCPCILINELNNMKTNYLSSSEQTTFELYLVQIRVVLVDVTITVKEKVSRIGQIIQGCFDANESIKKKIKHKKIDKWGRLHEFNAAGISFDSANVDSVMASQDSTGTSTLTTALLSGTANDACGTGTSATVQSYVGKMKLNHKKTTPGYGKERKLAHTYKIVNFGMYANNSSPSFKQCLESVNIPGFGSFGRFMRVCSQYQATTSVSSQVLNGTATQNALVQSVNSSLQSNATVQSTNTSVLAEANSFVQTLTSYFTTTSDVPSRLAFLSSQYSSLTSGCRYLLDSITVVVSGVLSMDFSDLITASHYCANNGCGNMTAGPASESWAETCIVDQAYNTSDIELVSDTYYYSFKNPSLSGFASTRNSITNCVRKQPTKEAALSCAKYYVKGFVAQASWRSQQFYCVLEETSTVVRFASVTDFINENP